MQKVDHYLINAKRFRTMAVNATEPLKNQFLELANEWEQLSQERLAVLEMKLQRTPRSQGGDGPEHRSKPR